MLSCSEPDAMAHWQSLRAAPRKDRPNYAKAEASALGPPFWEAGMSN